MARARNLKPSFFTNDTLAELSPLTRILFQGLWCLADREGRLEDRPKKIKAEVLPYDDCDVPLMLQTLHDHGFIHRYIVSGDSYIQVVMFAKHQNPHVKEAGSLIPAPDLPGFKTVLAGLIPDSPSLESISSAPPGVLDHVWQEWRKHRGKQSPTALKRQTEKLAELKAMGHDPNAVVLQSIERGWSGLFPIKQQLRAVAGPQDVEARAKDLNLSPRPGESMEQFVMRVRQTRTAA